MIGILLYVTQMFMTGTNKTNALVAGHANISIGLFLFVVLLVNQGRSNYLIASAVLLGALVAQLLYMTIVKYDRVSNEQVSSGFYTFNTISLILISLELFLKLEGNISMFISLLIGASNWIVYTILFSYVTDG